MEKTLKKASVKELKRTLGGLTAAEYALITTQFSDGITLEIAFQQLATGDVVGDKILFGALTALFAQL